MDVELEQVVQFVGEEVDRAVHFALDAEGEGERVLRFEACREWDVLELPG